MLSSAFALACPCCVRHRDGGAASRPRDALGGAHDIGFLGGLCLLTNNILSTGMVQIPGLFQSAGWALPTLAFVLTGAWTCVCALLLARVMTRIAGNRAFEKRVEFANVLELLLPRWASLAALFALLATFVASNISNVVVSAQVADDILLQAAGRTCALVLFPQPAAGASPFQCVALSDAGAQIADSPFGASYVVSAGFLVVAAICVPLSYVALDENVVFQVVGVALNIACVLVWAANFVAMGLSADNMPAFAAPPAPGSSGGGGSSWVVSAYSPLLPTVMFNFAFVATCPSWLNEKGPGISVTRTFVAACSLASALYLLLGVFGALSPVDFTSSGADVLTIIVGGQTPGVWQASQIAAYVFPAANLMTSIPIFSVMVRYNLVNARLMSPLFANAVAIGLPWALALLFYSGNTLSELINWSSAAFFGAVNLVLPPLLYLAQERALLRGSAGAGEALLSDDGEEEGEEEGKGDRGDLDLEAKRGGGGGGGGERGGGLFALRGISGGAAASSSRGLLGIELPAASSSDVEGRSINSGASVDDSLASSSAAALEFPAEAEDIRPAPRCCSTVFLLGDERLSWLLLCAAVAVSALSLALQAYSEYEQDAAAQS